MPNGNAFDVFIDGGKMGTGSVVTMDGSYTMGRLLPLGLAANAIQPLAA